MSSLFASDLRDVRIHESDAPRRLGAAAVTEGRDITFAPGLYQPTTRSGRFLLGHEIAHSLQQRAGRVASDPAGVLDHHPSLEREADLVGGRIARGEPAGLAPTTSTSTATARQPYIVYNPAVGGGGVANYGSTSTYNAQDKAGTASFMLTAAAPRIIGNPLGAQTPVRISANGDLAIEDSDLTNRQPKYFFARAALVPAWNKRLMSVGSNYELVVNAAERLTFDWNGAPRVLDRIDARNLESGTSGAGLTTAQFCEQMVKEVIGAASEPRVLLGRAAATMPPLQPGYETVYATMLQHYVADEIGGAGEAANIDLQHNAAGLTNQLENIALAYGTAMHGHHAAANPAVTAATQQMEANEFASPDVGEGIVTHRLGEQLGGVVQDRYNARVENNPGNATMWKYHWGGVIARDGGDYVTLENYARNAEDPHGTVGADPRFYFQMYGPGAQSWHDHWATVHPGGRNFTNPLTLKLGRPDALTDPVADAHHGERARWYFGGNVAAIADDYATVPAIAAAEDFTIALYKALAFAKSVLTGDDDGHGHSRTHEWLGALFAAAPVFPTTAQLHGVVQARLVRSSADKWNLDAHVAYGGNINAIKDDHALVAGAANAPALTVQLRKGLAYANSHLGHNDSGRKSRVQAWRTAVTNAPRFAATEGLRAHTLQRLQAVKT